MRGRVALVTGGASGIGLAMAEAFAGRGMKLVLCDRDATTLEAATTGLEAKGAEVLSIPLDVCDRAAWRDAADATQAFGPLTIVCANAGISPSGSPVSQTAPLDWDRIVAINLTGVYNTVHATTPLIKAHGEGGHIVLTSSMAGMLAAGSIGDYAVTKFGVGAMGEALRAELAPHRIGVSILYPGVVATPLVGESRSIGMAPEAVARTVLAGIDANQAFLFTHADYRGLVEARFAAIMAAFGECAQPGFRENDAVLAMMTPLA
jgi:NAD(P)-dependent dehydrogenase (short-subunit alcohol dehydrogenase family)